MIIADFFIKTVGTPSIGEKADADGAPKVVELEATRRHGVHNGCIMNNFHWNLGARYTNFNLDQGGSDLLFVATGEQVRVRGGGKWVSNNQKSDLVLGCVRQAFVRTLLNKLSVRNNHIASIKLSLRNKYSKGPQTHQLLGGTMENCGVVLQVHTVASLHNLQPLSSLGDECCRGP